MKHNWEYKKLGDICSIKSGYTPSSEKLSSSGTYPYYKVAEMNLPGNEKYMINTSFFLSGNIKTFPKGSIVFPKNGAAVATNKKRILHHDSVVDLNTAVMTPNKGISVQFLYNILLNIDFAILIKRGAVPTLNISILKTLIVPVPPMEVQEQIVEELDKINEVISDCRELLSNLSALEKSIFYDMFGDPISNPKGWEVGKLDDIIQPKTQILRAAKLFNKDEIISYIDISSIDRIINKVANSYKLIFSEAPSRAQQFILNGDLLISMVRPNLKNIALCHLKDKKIVASSGFCVLRSNYKSNNYFLLYLFLTKSVTEYLCSKVKGAAYPAITEKDIREMRIPCPPIATQEQFAKRIEAIETQKKKVMETITTLKTLLNSRMDYYFG